MIFFHELCHVIRHSGDQRWMPSLFKEAQEYDADRFALYSALPFFILKSITLPERKGESIGYIAHTFRVPLYFAKKRFEQIEERITQNKLLFALDAAVSTFLSLFNPKQIEVYLLEVIKLKPASELITDVKKTSNALMD